MPVDRCERVFILGAGFSKAVGMPLATELTELLIEAAIYEDDAKTREWLSNLHGTLHWLHESSSTTINVEELFHYAAFDAERWKMEQQRCRVGRGFGPATPYGEAEMIEYALQRMTASLVRIILNEQSKADAQLNVLKRFAKHLRFGDAILTFNYDMLVEKALAVCGIPWNHGLEDMKTNPRGVVVLKMHGSIDWLQLERGAGNKEKLTLLFSKTDENVTFGHKPPSDEHEYHSELWRINELCDIEAEIERQDGISPYRSSPGIASLGSHKPLHRLPGSGLVWARASGALVEADEIFVIGFSLSPFDAMAKMLFGEAMKRRDTEDRLPKCLHLVDPNSDRLHQNYLSVFHVAPTNRGCFEGV